MIRSRKSLLLVCPALYPTGFGFTSRKWIDVLSDIPDLDLYIHNIPIPGREPSGISDDYIKFIRSRETSKKSFDYIVYNNHLSDRPNYNKIIPKVESDIKTYSCLWEASRFPNDYHTYFDEMIANSEFISEIKGRVIPFKQVIHIPFENNFTEKDNSKIRYYTIAHDVTRKNLRQAFSCFCKAFTREDNVEFIIKIGDGHIENINNFKNIIKKFLSPPPIIILGGGVTDKDMDFLHNSCNIYFQTQHCEGLGIPHITALTKGNPLVSNLYGAVGEYANYNNSFPIKYELGKTTNVIKKGDPLYCVYGFENIEWAYMADEDVVKALKDSYDNYSLKVNKGISSKFSTKSVIKEWENYLWRN